tara:strand:+ start:66 stop:752 length:687 start_codon:yes stop_codon:yes gene_type:complete
MNDNNEYILVLGSKPDCRIPNLPFKYIYAANGAIEIANEYKKRFSKFELISILSGREFEKNLEVKKRVLNSSPDKIICRLGKVDLKKYNFPKKVNFQYLSNYQQLKIQSNFFNYGLINIFFLETFYEKNFLKKIMHMFRSIRRGALVGTSTGFFAILCALLKHPDKQILISGIGMIGGGHKYSDKDRYNKRSIVDRKLILTLKESYKNKLITTDKDLAKNANINFYGE